MTQTVCPKCLTSIQGRPPISGGAECCPKCAEPIRKAAASEGSRPVAVASHWRAIAVTAVVTATITLFASFLVFKSDANTPSAATPTASPRKTTPADRITAETVPPPANVMPAALAPEPESHSALPDQPVRRRASKSPSLSKQESYEGIEALAVRIETFVEKCLGDGINFTYDGAELTEIIETEKKLRQSLAPEIRNGIAFKLLSRAESSCETMTRAIDAFTSKDGQRVLAPYFEAEKKKKGSIAHTEESMVAAGVMEHIRKNADSTIELIVAARKQMRKEIERP